MTLDEEKRGLMGDIFTYYEARAKPCTVSASSPQLDKKREEIGYISVVKRQTILRVYNQPLTFFAFSFSKIMHHRFRISVINKLA
jgi:hypothetical protein